MFSHKVATNSIIPEMFNAKQKHYQSNHLISGPFSGQSFDASTQVFLIFFTSPEAAKASIYIT